MHTSGRILVLYLGRGVVVAACQSECRTSVAFKEKVTVLRRSDADSRAQGRGGIHLERGGKEDSEGNEGERGRVEEKSEGERRRARKDMAGE